jgi:hypothetical protein
MKSTKRKQEHEEADQATSARRSSFSHTKQILCDITCQTAEQRGHNEPMKSTKCRHMPRQYNMKNSAATAQTRARNIAAP